MEFEEQPYIISIIVQVRTPPRKGDLYGDLPYNDARRWLVSPQGVATRFNSPIFIMWLTGFPRKNTEQRKVKSQGKASKFLVNMVY